MLEALSVKDIMTKEVVSVSPETSVFEAHKIISSHYFNGVPVVDSENKLVGIITEYDLLAQGSSIEGFFNETWEDKETYERFREAMEKLKKTKVAEIMNKEPITLFEDASAQETVKAFVEHHRVNPIPVVDKEKKVIGVVSRYDALMLFYVSPQG